MALSEIIIDNLVQSQTNIAISESPYHTLRQYLLEKMPILSVTNSINKILSDDCDANKQKAMNQIIQESCKSQKNKDDQEAASDDYERNNDSVLKAQYFDELFIIDNSLGHLNTKCFQQQQYCNFLNGQIQELQTSLSQVNNNLDSIRNERRLLHARYSHSHSHSQPNVHGHYSTSPYYPQQHHDVIHIYPDLHTQFGLGKLQHEENILLSEQQRLYLLIATKNNESLNEQQNLNTFLKEKKQGEQRYSKIKHQVDVELPNKEEQRQCRHQERIARHYARTSYDPNLLQLSPQNLLAMKRQIETNIQDLDKRQNKLMQQAIEMSYPVYLTQLEYALQQTQSDQKLGFAEQNALRMILSMMKIFMAMAEKEKSLVSSLNDERNNLSKLQKSLAENTKKFQQYIAAEPLLVQKNKELNEENVRLEFHSKSAASYRASALYTSLFSIGTGLLSVGLINTLILSPVFFAVPGALAMLGLVSLTIALVAHCQKSSSDTQIEQNKKIISENERVLVSQWKNASELSLSIIPDLNAQIEQSEKTITWLEQQLIEQRYAMSQQLNKAQNVSCIYGGSPTFFSESTHFPTAPPEDVIAPTKDLGTRPTQ